MFLNTCGPEIYGSNCLNIVSTRCMTRIAISTHEILWIILGACNMKVVSSSTRSYDQNWEEKNCRSIATDLKVESTRSKLNQLEGFNFSAFYPQNISKDLYIHWCDDNKRIFLGFLFSSLKIKRDKISWVFQSILRNPELFIHNPLFPLTRSCLSQYTMLLTSDENSRTLKSLDFLAKVNDFHMKLFCTFHRLPTRADEFNMREKSSRSRIGSYRKIINQC